MGFVFDDLLRSLITSDPVKQSLEETCELVGATFFLAAVLAKPHQVDSESSDSADA